MTANSDALLLQEALGVDITRIDDVIAALLRSGEFATEFTSQAAALTAAIQTVETTAMTVARALAVADIGKVVEADSADAMALTVQPVVTVAYPDNARVEVYNAGAGALSLTAGAAVTLTNNTGTLAQGKHLFLRRRGDTDEWVVSGDLA